MKLIRNKNIKIEDLFEDENENPKLTTYDISTVFGLVVGIIKWYVEAGTISYINEDLKTMDVLKLSTVIDGIQNTTEDFDKIMAYIENSDIGDKLDFLSDNIKIGKQINTLINKNKNKLSKFGIDQAYIEVSRTGTVNCKILFENFEIADMVSIFAGSNCLKLCDKSCIKLIKEFLLDEEVQNNWKNWCKIYNILDFTFIYGEFMRLVDDGVVIHLKTLGDPQFPNSRLEKLMPICNFIGDENGEKLYHIQFDDIKTLESMVNLLK